MARTESREQRLRLARARFHGVAQYEGVRLGRATLEEWRRVRGHHMAAAMSFYALLSLAPLLLAAVAVAGLVWGTEAAQGGIVDKLDEYVGPQVAQAAQDIIQNAAAPVGSIVALAGSVLLLLFSASRIFIHLRESLNVLFEVPDPDERGLRRLLRARIAGLLMVLLMGGVLLATVVATAALSALTGPFDGRHPVLRVALHAIDLAVSLGILTVIFSVILRTIPQVRMERRAALVGGLVTGAGFVVGKTLLAVYLGRTAASSTYGGMGAAVLVLVWIYYSALMFILGATFTKTYARAHGLAIVPQLRSGFRRRRRAPGPPAAPSPPL